MTDMKTTTKTLALMTLLAAGCYTGTDGSDIEPKALEREETEEIIDNLLLAGFPEEEIGVLEDGTVFVGSDAVVTLEASREMAGRDLEADEGYRQYRTNNVLSPTVTTICLVPSAAFNGNATLSAGLDLAITRYNQQALEFTLQRNGAGCSATINIGVDASTGGVSGFPSNGLPYNSITIGTGTATYGTNVSAHVIEHEIGHTIGFRHTDYFNRSISCGGAATNEGDGGVGAIHIPGTPTNVGVTASTSVMNSCFSDTSTGVWTTSDVTALQYLYGPGGYTPPNYVPISTQNNLTAAAGAQTQYGPFDASTYTAMRFSIAGGTGDADLHVRFGAAPTTATYDCRPYANGNNESCTFDPSQAGNYYVMLDAYSAYSGVTLTVEGAGGAPPPPAEVCTGGLDEDGDGAVDCADTNCSTDPACAPPPPAWTQLSSTTFENNWGIFSDGGTDSRRLSNASYAHASTWSAELRDNTTTSVTTSSAFNLGGYTELQVDFWYYARSMENGEDFFVELWNGAAWVVIGNYARGTHFNNNALNHQTITVNSGAVNFSGTAQLRFRNDASDDTDLINIDDVVVSAR